MKNSVFFFHLCLLLVISTVAIGQTRSGCIETNRNNGSVSSQNNSSATTQLSEWYNYAYRLNQSMGNTLPFLYEYLFPDSTVKMLWSSDNSLHYVTAHSYGQVLDPTSTVFPNHLDQTTSYTLDSVGFWCKYFRYQHGAPDTLVAQVFNDDRIHFGHWTGGVDTPYAYVLYDTILRRSPNPSYQYKGLLDDTDTTTINYKFFSIAIIPPIVVPAGGKVAATLTYYPGNPHNVGDTIYPYTTPPPVNLINGLIIDHSMDVARTFEEGIYNNGLAAWNPERYNTSTIGWNGKYHPECAWWTESDNMDMAFKITTLNLSTQQAAENSSAITIFPNPTSHELNIDSKNNRLAYFKIYNSFGQLVNKGNLEPNLTTIHINNMENGIYTIELFGDHGLERKNFILEK